MVISSHECYLRNITVVRCLRFLAQPNHKQKTIFLVFLGAQPVYLENIPGHKRSKILEKCKNQGRFRSDCQNWRSSYQIRDFILFIFSIAMQANSKVASNWLFCLRIADQGCSQGWGEWYSRHSLGTSTALYAPPFLPF